MAGGKYFDRPAGKSAKMDRVAKIEKKVKKIERRENVESKFLDTFGNIATLPATGTVVALNAMSQGDGASARTGNSVIGKSIQLKCTAQQAGVTANQSVRIMLVRDEQCNGALPAVATLLQSAAYQSYLNDGNRQRFRILMDKTVSVSTSGPAIVNVKKYINLKDKVTRYVSNLGTIADVVTGAYYFVFLGDTSLSTLTYNIRFRFLDN